jgi:hypothetical protein
MEKPDLQISMNQELVLKLFNRITALAGLAIAVIWLLKK